MTEQVPYSISKLVSDLRIAGVKEGSDLIVHASLRSIGKVDGGYRNFLSSLLEAVGGDGTVIAPAFYYHSIDPALHGDPPKEPELEEARKMIVPFNFFLSQSGEGSLGDIIRLDPKGTRSNHPMKSWACIGNRALEYAENVPLDDTDGLESPIGRIYRRGMGIILFIGVGQTKNTSIHLAESLARAPHYLQTRLTVKSETGNWINFTKAGGCSNGFHKVSEFIDPDEFETRGKTGNAQSIAIMQKPFVDRIRDYMIKKPWALLCDNPFCRECARSRALYNLPPIK
jgi:aminoglycoside 3-N-acetyltransferase